MRKIVFLMIAAFACHDAHAQLDLHLGVSGSRSYSCLADLTDAGIGFGGGLEVAADLTDRFQFIGSLALDRHGADATSLPLMAGLRVSTTSDDDMFCFVQAAGGSAYRIVEGADNENAWVMNAGVGTVFRRLGAVVEYNVSRDKWSWLTVRTFLRVPLGF